MAAIAAIAVACALSVGPTATASASNWNHRSDYLKFPAPVNYTRCTQRHISLNGGVEVRNPGAALRWVSGRVGVAGRAAGGS